VLFRTRLALCQRFGICRGDEVCTPLLAKGFLLIKDDKLLDPTAFSELMYALVALMKRI
jgi:hypothetical protein